MTRHRPFSRKAPRSRFAGLETLESRLLLDSTLIPVSDHRELVLDPSRNQLLIVGTSGTINRYDISSGQLLTPLNLGFAPGGADITPDGQFLYVTRLAANSSLTLTRVNLATGALADFSIDVNHSVGLAALYDCAVLADGRVELTTINNAVNEAFLKFDPASSSFSDETLLNNSTYPTTEPASIFTSADRQTAYFLDPNYNSSLGHARILKLDSNYIWPTDLRYAVANPAFGAVNSDGTLCAWNSDNYIHVSFLNTASFFVNTYSTCGGIAFSPDSQRLYTVDPNTDALRIFDISNPYQNFQITQLPIGEDVSTANFNAQLALSPDGSQFFITTPSGIRILSQPAHTWTTSISLDIPASTHRYEDTPFTATISSTDPNADSSTPTGLAYFYVANYYDPTTAISFLGTAPLVDGVATFISNTLPYGNFRIFATYGGDANFSAATSSSSPIFIDKVNPQITVTPVGILPDGVFLTNVTGNINFSVAHSNLLATNEFVSLYNLTTQRIVGFATIVNGTASINFSAFNPGSYELRANYPGNTYCNATSTTFTVTVQKADVTLEILPLQPHSNILSVQLSPTSDIVAAHSLNFSGTLTLLENGHPIMYTPANQPLQFNLNSLSPGTHTLSAYYNSDTVFATASSQTLAVTVCAPTTTSLQLSPSAPVLNKPLTLSAAVSPALAGTVTFFDGDTSLGTAPVAQGAATFTFTPATGGNHTYTASFTPEGNYLQTSASASAYIYHPTTIDLLALYSNQQLLSAGSVDAIRTRLTAQINDTNTAFANSGLALSIRLAALAPANYSESGDLNKDWQRLVNPRDRYMDQIPALRNQVGADLVVLLDARSPLSTTNPTERVQGLASMLNTNYFGWSNQDQVAFLVVAQDAPLSDYILAHEIGHTLGIAHAADDPGSPGLAPDARGYRTTYNGHTYRDIMAYDPGIIVPCFSNPDIVQTIGIAMGQTATANAAHIIRITAPSVADYRSASPFGAITTANASSLSGWALDPKALAFASTIRIDIDGIPAATLQAGDSYAPLLAQFGDPHHAFTYQLPTLTPGRHTVSLYTLDAATGTPVFIASKTVTAHHLAWTLQTPSFIAGQFPTFSLAVKDLANHTVSYYQSTLTLSIYSGTAGAALAGTISAPVIDGIATFSNFTITKSGAYTLRATDGFLSLNSRRFSVLPDAASARLVLVSPALTEITVGKTFAPIIFNVQDQFANIVTSNRTPISLTLLQSPANSTLSGTTILTTRAGVAKFTTLRANQAGAYTLSAADSLLPISDSVQFTLSSLPATTTLPTLRPASYYLAGRTITLATTILSTAPTTIPFTGTLTLTDASNTPLATFTLTKTGAAKFLFPTPAPGTYSCHLDYSGDLNHAPATSNAFTLLIKPTV